MNLAGCLKKSAKNFTKAEKAALRAAAAKATEIGAVEAALAEAQAERQEIIDAVFKELPSLAERFTAREEPVSDSEAAAKPSESSATPAQESAASRSETTIEPTESVQSPVPPMEREQEETDKDTEPKLAKGAGTGITVPTLRAEIAKAFGPRAERLVGDILIPLNTQADIAGVSELADVALQIREGDLIKGFYHPMTGKTYAVLENLDPGDGKGLVLHEIGVHLGLKGMLGEENYAKVLRQMDTMRKAGNKVVIEAHEQATAQAVSEDQIPEESIAYLVTYAPQLPFVQRIISQIKAFLFRKFGILGDKLTPDDITALARASVLHASEGVRNGEAQFMVAWHGSPHEFEEFSLHKIGTGEGAAAYGWGLYFAGNREVAEYYRKALSGRDSFNGMSATKGDETLQGHDILRAYYKPGAVRQTSGGLFDQVISYDEENGTVTVKRFTDAALKKPDMGNTRPVTYGTQFGWTQSDQQRVIQALGKEGWAFKRGRLYQVDLTPQEDEYLDWDKPLSEQSEKVKAALAPILAPQSQSLLAKVFRALMSNERTGARLYRALQDRALSYDGNPVNEIFKTLGPSASQQEAASRYLASIGIPGIRYLDGSSRDFRILSPKESTSGKWVVGPRMGDRAQQRYFDDEAEARAYFKEHTNSNYVIFDDKLVKVQAKFQRTNEQGGAIGQVLRSPKLTGLMSAFKSPASFGIFRNINTQYHKAVTLAEQGKPHFKAVFDKVQDYINDISAIAVTAEQKAPAIFREITGLRPSSFKLHFKGAAKKSDIMAIAPWLNYGTLYGGGNPFEGRIWTKEELTSGFAIDTTKDGTSLRVRTGLKPLTEWQAELYLQARAALDQSIEDGAKAVVYRHVKRHDIDFAKTESLDRVVMTVKEQLETRKNEHSIRLEQADDTLNQAQDRVRDAETAYNINRRDFAAREELTAATKNLEKKQKQRDKIQADLDAITALLGTKEERGTIDKLHEHAQGLIDHGYMPLKRFGNKTVEARDKDNKVKFFGAYDGIPLVPYSATAEMNRVAAELKALHPEWTVSTGIKSERSWQMYNGLSLDALENFLDFLDPETKAELERDKTVQEYLTRAVNNRSVLKEMIHRKGTPGFSQDTDRVLASFITSHARNASAMYHIGEARGLIEQIPNEQGDIKDEATDLVNYVADPGEEAAKLRGFLFFHFLGGSIAAGIINLTQTPMMTIPRLFRDAPFKDVLKAAASAAKLAVMDPQTINSEKGRALQKAEREGITSPQQIYHLAAIASNNPFSSNKHFRTLMTVWGGLFATSEVFNRRVAFLSAYDIAKTNGKNETEAYTYAKGIVDETQLIYNKGNRMNWGRGPLGATILTFKTFTVGYLELLSRLPPKQQLMMLGVLLLASGLEGLPGEDDMEDVVNTLGQWLGFATNTGKWTGKVIRDNLGEEFERPILKGLGGMLAIDLHSRLGFGNIVPGTAFFVPSEINKGRDVAEAVGPVGSVFRNFMDSLALAARGKWDKAAIHSAPKAVRDLYNGMHMLATGESEDIKGRRGLTDVTTGEAFGKLIGFNPQRAAIESEAKREAMTDKNLRTIRMDEIASDWADAILRKDARKRQAAAERFRAWNRDNPEMMIAWAQMTRSVQERVRAARKTSKERFLKSLPKAMRREAQGSFQ